MTRVLCGCTFIAAFMACSSVMAEEKIVPWEQASKLWSQFPTDRKEIPVTGQLREYHQGLTRNLDRGEMLRADFLITVDETGKTTKVVHERGSMDDELRTIVMDYLRGVKWHAKPGQTPRAMTMRYRYCWYMPEPNGGNLNKCREAVSQRVGE